MGKGYLVDIDGTLYFKGQALPGAIEWIEYLNQSNTPYMLVTNTTSKTVKEIANSLNDIGFSVNESHIFTPNIAVRRFIYANHIKSIYFSGSRKIANEIGLLETPREEHRVTHVIIGDFEVACSYDEINRIFRIIDDGAELITTSESNYYYKSDGKKSVDTGAFVKMFEEICGVKAKLIGKPSSLFYNMALEKLNLSSSNISMVGDDVEIDVYGAQQMGFESILVESGKFFDKRHLISQYKPNLIIKDIASLMN